MINYIILTICCIDVLICWYSYYTSKILLKRITKPLFCLLLIGYIITSIELKYYIKIFCFGLFFSFCGDFLLLFPGLHFFACGLIFFLFSHICNVIGYFQTLFPGINIFAFLILTGGTISSVPLMHLSKSKTQKIMTLPVHIYSCGLVGGCFCAFLTLGNETGKNWNLLPSIMTSIGYIIFDISDAFLAYHTFVNKSMFAYMAIIITYHIAQILLITALVYNEQLNQSF